MNLHEIFVMLQNYNFLNLGSKHTFLRYQLEGKIFDLDLEEVGVNRFGSLMLKELK